MQNKLKQNIANLLKQKGISRVKLEQTVGLSKNFISNFLSADTQNPRIDSIIKLAELLDVSIDELIGKETVKHKAHDLNITRKDIFLEIINHLAATIQNKQNDSFKLDNFFNAAHEIYTFSLKKGHFDKEFADWFVVNGQL